MSRASVRRAIATTISTYSSKLNQLHPLSTTAAGDAAAAVSWLSTPGNPLMRWPPLKNPALQAPQPIIPNETSKSTLPLALCTGDADAVAAISHILLATATSNLDAALLSSPITPLPSIVESILSSHPSLPSTRLASLSRWAQPHLTPSLLTSLVDLLSRQRCFSSAWSLLLHHHDEPVPIPAFISLIRRYARAGMPNAAIRTYHYLLSQPYAEVTSSIDETEPPDPFLILIDALSKEGCVRAAAELLERHRSTASIRCYNVVLHGWFRSRKLKKAEQLWKEMRCLGVAPTVVTYGTLVEGLCRMRRHEQALVLLDEMRAAGLEPNHLILNPIVDALAEAGSFKEALGFLEKFPLYGVSPNISTFNSLVKGFCKNGDLVGASKVLKTMIGRGILPISMTYNYFFKHFSKFGMIEEGMNLYTKMVRSGYGPDRLTYQLLIKMLCEKERLELGMQMIKEMNQNGFESDLATSTMLVHLLCRLRRFNEACEEFEDMIKRGVVPQYITYYKLTKELKRLGMDDMARKVSDLMDSVPHSTKLPGSYKEREGDEVVERRKSIIRKAQVMSDALKLSKKPTELSNLKSSSDNAVERAQRLISDIRRRVYSVPGD